MSDDQGSRAHNGQARAHAALWTRNDLVASYNTRTLRPPEVIALVRYRDELQGRVLELGCGAGRLTGYLLQIGGDVLATDISETMIGHCRRKYPDGRFERADIGDLTGFADRGFDAIVAGYSVIDVLDHDHRRDALAELHRMLAPGGIFIFSSHNLGVADELRRPWQINEGDPLRTVRALTRLPRRMRNRARVTPHEQRADDHAILNDEAHDYTVLHYYVDPDVQTRRLEELGFEVLDRLDADGRPIAPGAPAKGSHEVHYVARRA